MDWQLYQFSPYAEAFLPTLRSRVCGVAAAWRRRTRGAEGEAATRALVLSLTSFPTRDLKVDTMFSQFSTSDTFILGGQFLLPQRANMEKREFLQLQN